MDTPSSPPPLDRFGIPVELACSGGRRTPLRNLLGWWQAARLTVGGPRWGVLPRRIRRAIAASPIGSRAGRRVVRSLDSFDGWHDAWVAHADESAERGNLREEVAAIGFARLSVGGAGDARDRMLVERLRSRYLSRPDLGSIERITVHASGTEAQGLLQLPDGTPPATGWPVVLVQAGIGEPKERIHRLATRAVSRGFACIRVDMPDAPATRPPGLPGVMEATIDLVARDPRLDAGNAHLFGSCLAGGFVLDGAIRRPGQVQSVVAISSWYHYEPTSELLPPSLLDYVVAGFDVERDESGRVIELPDDLSLRDSLHAITCPVRLYHGALDLVTSARETWAIAAELDPSRTETTVYALDGHGCTRHREQIENDFLDRAAAMVDGGTSEIALAA